MGAALYALLPSFLKLEILLVVLRLSFSVCTRLLRDEGGSNGGLRVRDGFCTALSCRWSARLRLGDFAKRLDSLLLGKSTVGCLLCSNAIDLSFLRCWRHRDFLADISLVVSTWKERLEGTDTVGGSTLKSRTRPVLSTRRALFFFRVARIQ